MSGLEFRNWSDYCERAGMENVLSGAANACFAARSTRPEAFLAAYMKRNVAVDVVESVSAVETCDGAGGFTAAVSVTLASGLEASLRGSTTAMIPTHPSTARTVCYTTMAPQGAAQGPRLSTPAAAVAPPAAKGAPPPPPKIVPLQGLQRYEQAVEYFKNFVAPAMRGLSVVDQENFDEQIISLEGTQNCINLLAPTVAALSLTGCVLGAKVLLLPLYRHIASLRAAVYNKTNKNNTVAKSESAVPASSGVGALSMPRPIVTLVAVEPKWLGRVRVREIALIPPVSPTTHTLNPKLLTQLSAIFDVASTRVEDPTSLNPDGSFRFNGFESLNQMVEWVEEIVRESGQGITLGTKGDEWGIALVIDGALSYKADGQKYNLVEGADASGGQVAEMLATLVKDKKMVTFLEDTHAEHDIAEMRRLMHRVGATVTVASAHLGAGNTQAIQRCASEMLCNNLVLRLNDFTTVSNLIKESLLFVRQYQGATLTLSTDFNEQHGVELMDVAVGLGVAFVRVGGIMRQERAAMLQRLLQIQSELGERSLLAPAEVIPTPEQPSSMALPPAPLEPVVELNTKPDKKKK